MLENTSVIRRCLRNGSRIIGFFAFLSICVRSHDLAVLEVLVVCVVSPVSLPMGGVKCTVVPCGVFGVACSALRSVAFYRSAVRSVAFCVRCGVAWRSIVRRSAFGAAWRGVMRVAWLLSLGTSCVSGMTHRAFAIR